MNNNVNNTTHPIVEKMENLFTNPEQLKPENVKASVREIAGLLYTLRNNLLSHNEAIRNQAFEQIATLKTQLEEKKELFRKAQSSFLSTFLATVSPEQKLVLDELMNKLGIKQPLSSKQKTNKKKPKSKRNQWMAG